MRLVAVACLAVVCATHAGALSYRAAVAPALFHADYNAIADNVAAMLPQVAQAAAAGSQIIVFPGSGVWEMGSGSLCAHSIPLRATPGHA